MRTSPMGVPERSCRVSMASSTSSESRTVKALPAILDRLVADGYQFATWDGKGFTVAKGTAGAVPVGAPLATSPGYSDSWAIVIGIDDYAKWPKLQYAARDAQAIRETLIQKFNFAPEHIVSLSNQEATRTGILAAFHDKLAHSGGTETGRGAGNQSSTGHGGSGR